jgi:hypothetical protein
LHPVALRCGWQSHKTKLMQRIVKTLLSLALLSSIAGCAGSSDDARKLDAKLLQTTTAGQAVLPPLPTGTIVDTPEKRATVLAELTAKPGLHNFIRGVGDQAAGKALQVRVSALVRGPSGFFTNHTAVLKGVEGHVHVTYHDPSPLLDLQVKWHGGQWSQQAWNQSQFVPTTYPALKTEVLAQLAPLLFVGLNQGWSVA